MIDPNQNVLPSAPMAPEAGPVTPPPSPGNLPLPVGADLAFWRGEVSRAEEAQKPHHKDWQDNLDWYRGKSPDAVSAGEDYINVNVDFYQVEQKLAQLFYETPDLQATASGPLTGRDDIVQAHKNLLDELLDEVRVLERAIHPAIKDCLCTAGVGPVMLGYQPLLRTVQPPMQPGSVLGLNGPVQVPIFQQFYVLRFSPKKLIVPADFHSTDWDEAPYLGMRFRMALNLAQREFAEAFAAQPDFKGTSSRDEYVLDESDRSHDSSGLNYVDGQIIFYKGSQFDPAVEHPQLYRELVLIDGLEKEARHRDCPHQTLLPSGQLRADSMIGNPIHPLSIRDVPDSSFTPSDTEMTRPLVRELCKFRTQMVQERDANRPFNLYETEKLPPDVVDKIEKRTVGSMIGVESLASGPASIMAPAITAQAPRQTYIQNDYIEKDIAKVLAIGPNQAAVRESEQTATEASIVDRAANVRLDAERRTVLKWYLRLVDKFSAMVCRYVTPQLAAQYLGPQGSQVWAQWDKQSIGSAVAFSAKPDSQIRLDAAAERRFKLQVYQMVANDPNAVRLEILRDLLASSGYDPMKTTVPQLPQKQPEPRISFSFTGADLIGPQGPMVRELMAQEGLNVSPQAVQESAGLLADHVTLGIHGGGSAPTPGTPRLAPHGGPAEQVRPLSKQQGDETGNRPGPSMEAA